jgi:hypothetical protein
MQSLTQLKNLKPKLYESRGVEVFAQMVKRRRACDDQDVRRAVEEPCESDLPRRGTERGCGLIQNGGLKQPEAASRPLLVRSIELIREIPSQPGRVSDDPERLSLLLWSGLHGLISLRINKPTLDWPPSTELAEHARDYSAQGAEEKLTPR